MYSDPHTLNVKNPGKLHSKVPGNPLDKPQHKLVYCHMNKYKALVLRVKRLLSGLTL
jgi:hypothetical protein